MNDGVSEELELACGMCGLLGFQVPLNSCLAVVILSHSLQMWMTESNVKLFSLRVKGYFDPCTFLDLTYYPRAFPWPTTLPRWLSLARCLIWSEDFLPVRRELAVCVGDCYCPEDCVVF